MAEKKLQLSEINKRNRNSTTFFFSSLQRKINLFNRKKPETFRSTFQNENTQLFGDVEYFQSLETQVEKKEWRKKMVSTHLVWFVHHAAAV